jgi:rod shape-determining protein MreC
VDYVPIEEKVEVGEWFYTSGDDRIFPRAFPVGKVTAVREAQPFKEIQVEPSGLQHGLEDMLIILSGVHQEIPDTPPGNQPVYIGAAPPDAARTPAGADASGAPAAASGAMAPATEADRLRAHYKALGDAQNHVFGENLPGQKPPNFNLALPPGGQPAVKQNGGQPLVKPDGVPPPKQNGVPPPKQNGGQAPAQQNGAATPAKPPGTPAKSPAVPPGGGGR